MRTFISLTWNIEGISRNIFNLKHFIDIFNPDLLFISEPQLYQCNLNQIMSVISADYKYSMNSFDLFDPELPLIKSKAYGGTLVMWKTEFDPHITVYPVQTTAFLPINLSGGNFYE